MMSDISGFSTLTRELTRDSARGAETLQELLDNYFGAIGDIIAEHGGDIATFAGDAVIAVWPAGEDLQSAAKLATQCALKIQGGSQEKDNGKNVKLTQRIAVSSGELVIAKLGGVQGKWLNVFAGQPIIDAGHACDIAKPGDVLNYARSRRASRHASHKFELRRWMRAGRENSQRGTNARSELAGQ